MTGEVTGIITRENIHAYSMKENIATAI